MKNLCRQGRWSQHLFWCILPFLCWKQVGQGAVDSKQIQWGRLLAAASITSGSSPCNLQCGHQVPRCCVRWENFIQKHFMHCLRHSANKKLIRCHRLWPWFLLFGSNPHCLVDDCSVQPSGYFRFWDFWCPSVFERLDTVLSQEEVMFFYMFDLIFSFVWLFFLVLKVSLLFYHEFTKVSLLTWNLSLQKSPTSFWSEQLPKTEVSLTVPDRRKGCG